MLRQYNKQIWNFKRLYSDYKTLGKTFGEFEKDSLSNNESEITKIKENNMYKNFFQDFQKLKKDSQNNASRITSFEEQKSFKQVFDYLSKESNKIGVIKSLETFVNYQSPVQSISQSDEILNKTEIKTSYFSNISGSINLEKQYKVKLELNKKYIQALSPTFEFINKNINTNDQMYKFIQNKIIDPFINKSSSSLLLKSKSSSSSSSLKKKNSKKMRKLSSIEEINNQSLLNPENPIIDIQTLPILLRFTLNSLTFDFNSISTSFLIIDFIKKHESIELYEFGLNIDVYNSLLIQIWSKTENLNLISNLIDELKINAIQPDLYTFKILSKIYLHCMRVKDTIKSEPYILWNKSSNVHKIKDYLQDFRFL
jgi:hypothetical protein